MFPAAFLAAFFLFHPGPEVRPVNGHGPEDFFRFEFLKRSQKPAIEDLQI